MALKKDYARTMPRIVFLLPAARVLKKCIKIAGTHKRVPAARLL
jgi:hypothetical protein